jgi:hypothetical protein
MLQKQAVSKKLLGLVETLQNIPALNDFVLVGGTPPASRTGHRISGDIGLFTQTDIDQYLFTNTLDYDTVNEACKVMRKTFAEQKRPVKENHRGEYPQTV